MKEHIDKVLGRELGKSFVVLATGETMHVSDADLALILEAEEFPFVLIPLSAYEKSETKATHKVAPKEPVEVPTVDAEQAKADHAEAINNVVTNEPEPVEAEPVTEAKPE